MRVSVCVSVCVCVCVCVRKGEERVNVGVERKMHQGHTTDVFLGTDTSTCFL